MSSNAFSSSPSSISGIAKKVHQFFNQGYLDRRDPIEAVGIWLGSFSFSNIYEVPDPQKLSVIIAKLYDCVADHTQKRMGNDVRCQRVVYQDVAQREREQPREYITITRETNRKTRITVVARFLPCGNQLYVSVDSYVLGSIKIKSLLFRVAVTLLPFLCLIVSIFQSLLLLFTNSMYGQDSLLQRMGQAILSILSTVLCCMIPWVAATIPVFWIGVIRSYRQEANLNLALRQNFNRIIDKRSFNIDDVLMTLKSSMPLIIFSIRDVFTEFGIPAVALDNFVESIKVVNNYQYIYGSYNSVSVSGTAQTENHQTA